MVTLSGLRLGFFFKEKGIKWLFPVNRGEASSRVKAHTIKESEGEGGQISKKGESLPPPLNVALV